MIHTINNCISITSSKEKDFSKVFLMTCYVKFWTLKAETAQTKILFSIIPINWKSLGVQKKYPRFILKQ